MQINVFRFFFLSSLYQLLGLLTKESTADRCRKHKNRALILPYIAQVSFSLSNVIKRVQVGERRWGSAR